MIPLSGRFYHCDKGPGRSVKNIRTAISRQTFYRPSLEMSNEQSNFLERLYRGDLFTVIYTRMLFRSQEDLNKFANQVFTESYIPDRKLFLSRMEEFMGKTKANELWNRLTGVDVTDSELSSLLKHHGIIICDSLY